MALESSISMEKSNILGKWPRGKLPQCKMTPEKQITLATIDP